MNDILEVSFAPDADGVVFVELREEPPRETVGGELPFEVEVEAVAWQPIPCESNGDCDSGYCLEVDPLAKTSYCTIPCVEDCPGGWQCKLVYFNPPDLVSLCVPPDDEDWLLNLRVSGWLWTSSVASVHDDKSSIEASVGGIRFVGETTDGAYVIRPGLPAGIVVEPK
jgi:hypothetical protein